MKTRLVQIENGSTQHVALVEEPRLRLLEGVDSVYELVRRAMKGETSLSELARELASDTLVSYDAVFRGESEWRLLTPIQHPEPSRCLVSGTGLTHLGSAMDRQAMHSGDESELNDSMRMFKWGVEQGKPSDGKPGVAPEWFYKGCGTILRGPFEPLEVPPYAEDGGEEAEVAGVYVIDDVGKACRVGFAIGNEFSDHQFEKRNYLNLAGSKLRNCSLGPELVINPDFRSVPGRVTIERGGKPIWTKEILTGEDEMCHSLANIEHHHFKFEGHRRPGDMHVHYLGACALSFGAGVTLESGDIMEAHFDGMGRPLRNPILVRPKSDAVCAVRKLL